jgi:hypothetical protein
MRMRTDLTARDRWIIVLIGLFFLLPGLCIVAIGLHWIPTDPAKMHAPGWVVALCGLPFVGGGVAILDFMRTRDSPTGAIVGLTMFLAITVVTHWVAFGPGSRQFTRIRTVGTMNAVERESEPIDEATGRGYFAVGAVMQDLVIATWVIWRVRRRQARCG